MKRAFLCAVLMLMCVSSAFGGEKEDLALVQAVMDSNSTPAQIKALMQMQTFRSRKREVQC